MLAAPHFVSFLTPTSVDAAHETEALLDHYLHHANTPPFIAHRYIQRFVSSNPSPRYVLAVATAFRTGEYDGVVYGGGYGDLAATIAAVLLDREARSMALDADPHHGVLREPLLKVHHFLRAMEFLPAGGRGEVQLPNIEDDIGMNAHKSPSVFNFYQPEYQPAGPIARAGLVAPEGGLATAPYLIGYLNGMLSLAEVGLSGCFRGFGKLCAHWRLRAEFPGVEWSDGALSFAPSPPAASASGVVEELSLLLTGGRLNVNATAVITSHYEGELASSGDPAAALKLAQQLMITAPEFHATNLNPPSEAPPRVPSASGSGSARSSGSGGGAGGSGSAGSGSAGGFKAIIVIYLAGGADTYNLLVPHSNCASRDLFAHYEGVRGDVALPKATLLDVAVTEASAPQPCATFGVHPALEYVRQLYNEGDAAFVANVGTMIEPLTREEYHDGSKRIPPQGFAHNMGTKAAHSLHPQDMKAQGVLGRMLDVFGAQRQQATAAAAGGRAYSISGNAKIVEGETVAPDIISAKWGSIKLELPSLAPMLSQVLAPTTSSVFGETYAALTATAIERSQLVADALDSATLTQSYAAEDFSEQLTQVAKVINASAALQTERGAFYVKVNGFDTHSDVGDVLEANFGQINRALRSFVAEMKAMGRWDDVAIFTKSEFGRTLTSNGLGTDHGWGGNHVVLGGAVKGGKILGKYPDDLSDAGPLSTGRGRIIPTAPWEAVWKPRMLTGGRTRCLGKAAPCANVLSSIPGSSSRRVVWHRARPRRGGAAQPAQLRAQRAPHRDGRPDGHAHIPQAAAATALITDAARTAPAIAIPLATTFATTSATVSSAALATTPIPSSAVAAFAVASASIAAAAAPTVAAATRSTVSTATRPLRHTDDGQRNDGWAERWDTVDGAELRVGLPARLVSQLTPRLLCGHPP